MGRSDEALAEMKRATELDPLSLIINTLVGWVYYRARNYDQAITELQRTLEMDPNFVPAHLFLGWSYQQKGLFKEAIAEFESAKQLSESGTVALAGLGHVYAKSGQTSKARKVLSELMGLSADFFRFSYDIALIYVAPGRQRQGIRMASIRLTKAGVKCWCGLRLIHAGSDSYGSEICRSPSTSWTAMKNPSTSL